MAMARSGLSARVRPCWKTPRKKYSSHSGAATPAPASMNASSSGVRLRKMALAS